MTRADVLEANETLLHYGGSGSIIGIVNILFPMAGRLVSLLHDTHVNNGC